MRQALRKHKQAWVSYRYLAASYCLREPSFCVFLVSRPARQGDAFSLTASDSVSPPSLLPPPTVQERNADAREQLAVADADFERELSSDAALRLGPASSAEEIAALRALKRSVLAERVGRVAKDAGAATERGEGGRRDADDPAADMTPNTPVLDPALLPAPLPSFPSTPRTLRLNSFEPVRTYPST